MNDSESNRDLASIAWLHYCRQAAHPAKHPSIYDVELVDSSVLTVIAWDYSAALCIATEIEQEIRIATPACDAPRGFFS